MLPETVSQSDALQLLFNRQASLLIGFAELSKTQPDISYLQVQLCKPLFAMMCALLIGERRYVVRVNDQLDLIQIERSSHKNDLLWKIFQNEKVMSLMRTAVDFKHDPKPNHFKSFARSIETIASNYHRFMIMFIMHHYGIPQNSSLEEVIRFFSDHQPLQTDIISPGWWACWLRSRAVDVHVRFPRRASHPQVTTYINHTLWMAKYLSHKTSNQTGSVHDLQFNNLKKDLHKLINTWEVSGYGCRLR